MGIWQTCRKELAKFPKKFRSVSQQKRSKNLFFSEKNDFSSNLPLEKWNAAKKTCCSSSNDRPNIFRQTSMVSITIKYFFPNTNFPQIFSATCKMQVCLTTLTKMLHK